jgi:hypothetical protein
MPTGAQTSNSSTVSEICESPNAENNEELPEINMSSTAALETSCVKT